MSADECLVELNALRLLVLLRARVKSSGVHLRAAAVGAGGVDRAATEVAL